MEVNTPSWQKFQELGILGESSLSIEDENLFWLLFG